MSDNSDKIEQTIDVSGKAEDVTMIGKLFHSFAQLLSRLIPSFDTVEQRIDVSGKAGNITMIGKLIQIIRQQVVHVDASERRSRNRHIMIERVRRSWIEGKLEPCLHGATILDMNIEERVLMTDSPCDKGVAFPGPSNRPLAEDSRVLDAFDQTDGIFLILGEPGSGKTTTLLQLARDTLVRAENDAQNPIPVVLHLSTWALNQPALDHWLIEELQVKYEVPEKIAREWIENNELLLLLDGLDEVKAVQSACVEAINDFRRTHGMTSLVICSRLADYEALKVKLKAKRAVVLQPLTPEQVSRYISGANLELRAVQATLRHDAPLQELAKSPLMLSIISNSHYGAESPCLKQRPRQ